MHSSGWMCSIWAVSNAASSLRGWMQSTGHTSTHALSLVPMQGSVITYAIQSSGSVERHCTWWRAMIAPATLSEVLMSGSFPTRQFPVFLLLSLLIAAPAAAQTAAAAAPQGQPAQDPSVDLQTNVAQPDF